MINLNFGGLKKVKQIIHLADIHIRLLDRHTEYREVLNNLYSIIKNETEEDSIIFLGGDIVHSKLEMSPELVNMVSDFLTNLTNLRPVILIKGNHDLNVKNTKRMDVLYPIVKTLNIDTLNYIDDYSENYIFNNLEFALYPFWSTDNPNLYNNTNLKIGMYHGALNGAKTDTGASLETNNNVNRFDGMDIVLLGDIHKYQTISNKPITVYPGSLVQQDFGENVDGHGFVLWDIEDVNNISYKHIEIENDYGLYTVNINENEIVENLKFIKSKYPTIRVNYNNKDKIYLDEIKLQLKEVFPDIKSIIPNKLIENNGGVLVERNKFDSEEKQIEVLKTWFTDNKLNYSNIEKLHCEILTEIKFSEKVKNNIWRPIHLSFSNLFSYGEDNYLNFKNLNGSYGIFAPNASGKSSLMEVISYVCFNKTSTTSQVSKIINTSAKHFNVKFVFEFNGENYLIERNGKIKNTKLETNSYFYKVDNDFNELENLTKGKNDLNKEIRNYIGTYDDFILTALSIQGIDSSFVSKKQSERKALIQQFLELDIFEQLYKVANIKKNSIKSVLTNYSNKVNLLSKNNHTEIDNELGIEFKDLTKNQLKYQKELNGVEKIFNEQLVKYDDSISNQFDIEELIRIEDKLTNNLKDNLITYKKTNLDLLKSQTDLEELKQPIREITKDLYNELSSGYNVILRKKTKLEIELENLTKLYNDKLSKFKFNDDCNECKINQETLDINNIDRKIKDLNVDIIQCDLELKEFLHSNDFVNIIDLDNLYTLNQRFNNTKLELTNEISKFKLWLDSNLIEKTNIDNNIEINNNKIIVYKDNKVKIENNNEIKKEININTNKITYLKNLLKELNISLTQIHTKITTNKVQKQELEKISIELQELNNEYNDYLNYTNAVGKDGIPLKLMKNVIGVLEDEVNNILTNITNFKIRFILDESSIDANIIYNDVEWDVATVSGMEKFIVSLAIRIGLINISQLPRPNFICIDEGFGVLDKENLNELKKLFEYFKSNFNFFFIISHIEILRDFVDKSIDINKINGYSEIKF